VRRRPGHRASESSWWRVLLALSLLPQPCRQRPRGAGPAHGHGRRRVTIGSRSPGWPSAARLQRLPTIPAQGLLGVHARSPCRSREGPGGPAPVAGRRGRADLWNLEPLRYYTATTRRNPKKSTTTGQKSKLDKKIKKKVHTIDQPGRRGGLGPGPLRFTDPPFSLSPRPRIFPAGPARPVLVLLLRLRRAPGCPAGAAVGPPRTGAGEPAFFPFPSPFSPPPGVSGWPNQIGRGGLTCPTSW